MSFHFRFTQEAKEDLERLYAFAAENDPAAAQRALETIGKAWEILENFPFSCRKAEGLDAFFSGTYYSFRERGLRLAV